MRKAAITAAFARTPLGEELPLLGVALDRGAVARADLDPLRLRLLRLLQVDLEDPVLVVGADVALGDALRHPERARERPVAALEALEPLVRLLLRALALPRRDHDPYLCPVRRRGARRARFHPRHQRAHG